MKSRADYKLFSRGKIGRLTVPNRLVRSATWDPSILHRRQVSQEVLDLYRKLAQGGVGLIITGDFPVMPADIYDRDPGRTSFTYQDVRIAGIEQLSQAVHHASSQAKIIAQLARGIPGPEASDIPSPYTEDRIRPLTLDEIHTVVASFVQTIAHMQVEGFDGVQLHAAHGSLLSRFLSPYSNRRTDQYGGSVPNRARIVQEIICRARELVGDFPILIKMNGTDYVEGGLDLSNFAPLAQAIAAAGVDAIEISGGMWDCFARSQDELGFRRVPAPESHTNIRHPRKQSYFLPYAESLDLDIPVILVGGNRDVERLEAMVQQNKVDFVALCRPFISEPDLPQRWLDGRGSSGTECISCNSCLYDMYVHPGRDEPGLVRCLFKTHRELHKVAQRWLYSWVDENVVNPV